MTANNYAKIPEELRLLPQWMAWGKDKVPYNVITGEYGSVINPSDWTTFDNVISAISKRSDYNGPGFVFTGSDKYTLIDLDDTKGDQVALNRQIEIHREMDSYSEISPSGRGLHIIVRGCVPAGRRRSYIELYSNQRYATFTGNVYNDRPIADRQDQLMQLWHQMGSGTNAHSYTGDQPEKYTDEQIIERASSAVNGDKFSALLRGQWQDRYPSQSEADLAFINMLAFYTKNRNQISRIFRAGSLGQRPKAQRSDYLSWMINKAFDRDLPPIDFDGLKQQVETKLVNGYDAAHMTEPTPSAIGIPPGFLGEIADFLYKAAPLPVPEIAIAGAIGLMAGICGRSYNVNEEGLNQYILLVAQSGTGKESMASGIDKIVNAVGGFRNPTIGRLIGPGEITSGEALIRYINKPNNQCFLTILSEFGHRLQLLSDKKNFAQSTLKRMLLQLYHSSGKGRIFKPKIFSDKDKDIGETRSPALSILAESPPGPFYECVTEEIIADGFLPRFIIIEYKGERVALNKNMAKAPTDEFVRTFSSFFAHCEMLNSRGDVVNVQATLEVMTELDRLQEYARDMINKNAREDVRQLWNRAHIKTWKLAALVAVGCNFYNSVIEKSHFDWAVKIVHNDIHMLSEKFETGEVGVSSVEVKQIKEIVRTIKEYYIMPSEKLSNTYHIKDTFFKDRTKIPYVFLQRRLASVAAFNKKDINVKGTPAIKNAIGIMIDRGELRECSDISMREDFRGREVVFVVTDVKIFDDEK